MKPPYACVRARDDKHRPLRDETDDSDKHSDLVLR